MSNEYLIKKYKPENINDFIGNSKNLNIIDNWFKNYKNNINYNLLLTGQHGIGKTLSIELLAKKNNFKINYINFSNIKNLLDVITYIKLINKEGKNIILIDKIETIISRIDKKIIEELRKVNEKKKHMMIVYISNDIYCKYLINFKKTCLFINLYPPSKLELINFVNKVSENEKIIFENNNVKNKIIDYCQYDIRRLIYILQDLYYIYNKKTITKIMVKEYFNNSNKKNIEVGLFDAAQKLFYEENNINDIITLYMNEKSKLPLMIHENYYKCILKSNKSKKEKLETIKNISDLLSDGDFFEYHIYHNQEWDMLEYVGFYTCVNPSYLLNNYTSSTINNNITFKFPEDLNKTSIKSINKKNINNIEANFTNINIYDYIHINKIIKKLLENKDLKSISCILKSYNLDINQLESLLKIDKIINTKNNCLTIKNKRDLENLLKN